MGTEWHILQARNSLIQKERFVFCVHRAENFLNTCAQYNTVSMDIFFLRRRNTSVQLFLCCGVYSLSSRIAEIEQLSRWCYNRLQNIGSSLDSQGTSGTVTPRGIRLRLGTGIGNMSVSIDVDESGCMFFCMIASWIASILSFAVVAGISYKVYSTPSYIASLIVSSKVSNTSDKS